MLQVGLSSSVYERYRQRRKEAMCRRTGQLPDPYRRWLLRLRHIRLQMRRLQKILHAVRSVRNETNEQGHRAAHRRMDRHKTYH